VQHRATQCNTVQHSATQCNTVQHSAAPCNTVQHSATQCNILLTEATPYHHITSISRPRVPDKGLWGTKVCGIKVCRSGARRHTDHRVLQCVAVCCTDHRDRMLSPNTYTYHRDVICHVPMIVIDRMLSPNTQNKSYRSCRMTLGHLGQFQQNSL